MDSPDTAPRRAPYDIDLEQSVLGAILIDGQLIERVEPVLEPQHFYDAAHQRIYEAMRELMGRGRAITPQTVKAAIEPDPGLAELGGIDYLFEITRLAPAAVGLRECAETVAALAKRRELLRVAEEIATEAAQARIGADADALIAKAEEQLYRVAEARRFGKGFVAFSAAITKTIELAERAARRGRISGVETGFHDLDRMLGGLNRSDLIVLAGRPGSGKTSFATNMAFNVAYRRAQDVRAGAEEPRGGRVAFFSLEMSDDQVIARILAEQSRVPVSDIRSGAISDPDKMERFMISANRLRDLPFFTDDTAGLSIAQIAARARRLKRELGGLEVVVVDYLQLVEAASGRFADNKVQQVTEVSKGLKGLAKELDVAVVALSQLSRAVERRENKSNRPMLSDLRESGAIEQDADVVMFVHREELYLKNKQPEDAASAEYLKWKERYDASVGKAELIVEKHRHGATGTIDLTFQREFTRFDNAADDARVPDQYR